MSEYEYPKEHDDDEYLKEKESKKEEEEIKESLEILRMFLAEICRHPSAFDEEDKVRVRTVIEQLEKKQRQQNSVVKQMEQSLRTRTSVIQEIDSQTGLLARHPDLMKAFVEKQAQLIEVLNEFKKRNY